VEGDGEPAPPGAKRPPRPGERSVDDLARQTPRWTQATGIFVTSATRSFGWWLLGSFLLGLGMAMVYPSLIAAVSDASHPSWRARSLSVYRFWRDLGYAVGALSAGIIADTLGISWAITLVGALTFVSGAVVAVLMRKGTE
jgi:MFS family permease